MADDTGFGSGILDFLKTPEGQGVLAAGFGGLAGARRGQPLNSIGRGGVAGILGYSNAIDNKRQQDQFDLMKQNSSINNRLSESKLRKDMQMQDYLAQAMQGLGMGGQAPQAPSSPMRGFDPSMNTGETSLPNKPIVGNFDVSTPQKRAGMEAMLKDLQKNNPAEYKNVFSAMQEQGLVEAPKPQGPDWRSMANTGAMLHMMGNDGGKSMIELAKLNKPEMEKVDTGSGFVWVDKNSPNIGPISKGYTPMERNEAAYKYGDIGAPTGSPMGVSMPTGGSMPQQSTDDQRAPWRGMPPSDTNVMRRSVYEQEAKKLTDLREQIAKGQGIMNDLERFGQLNREEGTGGVLDRIGLPSIDADKREMEAITARLGPSQRAVGSGASSDRDVSLFLSSIPNVAQEGPVNRNIRDQFSKNLELAQNKYKFMEDYLAKYGHLNGAEQDWIATQKDRPKEAQAAKAQALPANPSASNLKKGSRYQTKYGELEWDGMQFKEPN